MNKTNITIGIIILVIAAAVLFFFFRGEEPPVYDEFGNMAEAQVVGADLLQILAGLREVRLSSPALSSQRFLNLIDHSTALPSVVIGRPNPFEVIGVDAVSANPPAQQSGQSSN